MLSPWPLSPFISSSVFSLELITLLSSLSPKHHSCTALAGTAQVQREIIGHKKNSGLPHAGRRGWWEGKESLEALGKVDPMEGWHPWKRFSIWTSGSRGSTRAQPGAPRWSLKTLRRSSLEHQGVNNPNKSLWVSLCSWSCHLVACPRTGPPLMEGMLPQMWVGLIRRDANRAWKYHQRLLIFP